MLFLAIHQRKHPNPSWEWAKYGIVMLEMFALAFFCVDRTTHQQTPVSKGLNFVDISSLQPIIAKYSPFVSIGLLAYVVLLLLYLFLCAVLYTLLVSKQPWLISLVRNLTEITLTILFIPLLNLAITQFDCHIDASQTIFYRGTTIQYFDNSEVLTVVGLAMSLIFLVIFVGLTFLYHLLIFQHNPKYGGFFSAPSFHFQLVEAVLLFGSVFAMRMLIDWPFWRFAVTVGVSILLVFWAVFQQPYYRFKGNFLAALKWTIFGCIRALLELGYLISGFIKTTNAAMIQLIISIVCGVVGLGCGIGLSIFFFKLIPKQSKQRWLLTEDGMPLADPDNPATNTLPKMKNYVLIEPAVRFIQEKEFKTFDYLTYVDLIYTTALKRHKTKADLQFHYANFLANFRKNHVKAQSVYRTARMSNPAWPLRFLLFCQTKEVSSRGGVGNEMANAQFQAQMSKAEEMHDIAKNAMRDFFSNMTAPRPRLNVIPTLLHLIVVNEAKARKIYEGMLNTHPQSTQLLRQYAALLLDIFHDEDMADIILARADQIEEDSTVTLPTATGGTDPQDALQPMDPNAPQDEKASHMSGASGASGASMQKKKKQKKKKKKRGDALVTELGGSGGSDFKSTQTMVCVFLSLLHMAFIAVVVVALVVYISMSSTFSQDLSTLREITRLAEYTGRTATYGLMFIVHELQYGFLYESPKDGKGPAVLRESVIRAGLEEGSAFLTKLATSIFELTSFIDPWVSPDVETYNIRMALEVNPWSELGTDPEPMVQDETMNSVTLLESLVLLAQKTSELANCEKVPTDDGSGRFKITYPTFLSDMMYLLANSQQPIMNGIKRAVFAYMDETTQSATTMIIVYVAILVGGGVLVMFCISFVAFYFTTQMMKIRRLALMDLLEVPKPKLQSVIRRLIATNGDETMTGTMTHSVDESIDEKSEDEEDADKEAVSDDNTSVASEDQSRHEGALHTSTSNVSDSNNNTQMNPLAVPHPLQQIGLSQFATPSDFRLPQTSSLILSPTINPNRFQTPVLNATPGQTTSQVNNIPFVSTPLLGQSQNMPIGLQPMGVMQTTSLLSPVPTSGTGMPPQSMSLIQMPGQTPNFNPMMGGQMQPSASPMNVQQLGMQGMMGGDVKKQEAKQNKAEEKKKKAEAEELKRKAEEKRQREEEARRKKEEEAAILASGKASDAQKGYVRDVVPDEKWEEKGYADIDTLTHMHANLPSPLSFGIVIRVVLNLSLGVLAIVALAVVTVVLVLEYSNTNVNITMSGMRTSVLSLIEYLNVRILFNYANVTPKHNITFPRSTNPVFKGFEHLSNDRSEVYSLLVKASAYFQQLHSATHYGDSIYARTNDTYYDDVITERLSTDENEKTLLQSAECFMETTEVAKCNSKNRIFNVEFPVSGLSTLISQMRLYVWLIQNEYELRDSSNKRTYNDLHPIPRYIGSACRYDLRSGINTLTNEILASSQKSIALSQGILGAVSAVVCVFLFVALFVFSMMWLQRVMDNNMESKKLLELLPINREEKEIDLLPSMMTGYPPLDTARMKIIDAAGGVLESLTQNDKPEVLLPNIDYLMITTTQVFAEEEMEMDKRDYEHAEQHAREHLLLRQRLTVIADSLKHGTVPSMRIAKRNLVRLYDRHFIDDDVQFGNSIPAEEKMALQLDVDEMGGEEANDVGELGEPGQE
ncbi:hypothetical protein BLNAU_20067 [Blattamonas nauphoetae]|uniref:TmcB/TmcC TPR repeats domain-containing protein n=1 Tax=Blattamonas nauphoetae TaxID=2049346 RepID=A0ABQ9WZR3_9EUKA|nr:hypothetical protein BLNAU_20067 [Blattamonas nauphoetae]